MMVGKRAANKIGDSRVILVIVQANVAVWRDVYYAVRHGDGRQRSAERGVTTSWRLATDEFFVLGDNAPVSDDSRSWLSGPGVEAKLLIGKPLGAR